MSLQEEVSNSLKLACHLGCIKREFGELKFIETHSVINMGSGGVLEFHVAKSVTYADVPTALEFLLFAYEYRMANMVKIEKP